MMGRIFSALEANMTGVLMPGYQSHYLHCIDYIRQGVMCAGDVSLEPHSPLDGPDNGPLDGGWNGIHGTSVRPDLSPGSRVVVRMQPDS